MKISSFLIDDRDDVDVVVTTITSAGRHHIFSLHWITETCVEGGLVRDGRITFLEVLVGVGPFYAEFMPVGDAAQ
jgi:hypothetical protein